MTDTTWEQAAEAVKARKTKGKPKVVEAAERLKLQIFDGSWIQDARIVLAVYHIIRRTPVERVPEPVMRFAKRAEFLTDDGAMTHKLFAYCVALEDHRWQVYQKGRSLARAIELDQVALSDDGKVRMMHGGLVPVAHTYHTARVNIRRDYDQRWAALLIEHTTGAM